MVAVWTFAAAQAGERPVRAGLAGHKLYTVFFNVGQRPEAVILHLENPIGMIEGLAQNRHRHLLELRKGHSDLIFRMVQNGGKTADGEGYCWCKCGQIRGWSARDMISAKR
jgi:hypothetical protein